MEAMAILSPKICINRYKFKCVSLPVRSRPCISQLEDALIKLEFMEKSLSLSSSSSSSSSAPDTEAICTGLSGLAELYECIAVVVASPDIQQALSQYRQDSSMNEMLEVSLKHLDICSNTREATLQIKEGVRELQSAIRRKKGGDFGIDSYIDAYTCCRKKIKKDIFKSLGLLKEKDITFEPSPSLREMSHQSTVLKALREVVSATSLIFHSLLTFLSMQVVKPKPRKWELALKLVNVRSEVQHDKIMELAAVEVELKKLLAENVSEDAEAERLQSVLAMLEAVEATIEEFEKELERLFRLMIQARVSLLNLLSI